MSKRLLIFFALLLGYSHITAQQVDNISYAFEQGMIVVRYDFLKAEQGIEYELFLYSSHDNFQKPLQQVTGDVGRGIEAGNGKVIYWDAKSELGNFKGKINLQIKGEKYTPLAIFDEEIFKEKIKRGQDFEIRWTSGYQIDEKVQLDIRRYNSTLRSYTIDNSGSFIWKIPSDLKTGDGYSIRICKPDNPLKGETSDGFRIKTKIPASIKILPAIVVAGTVGIIYGMSGKAEGSIEGPPQLPAEP
jgi:hypothetical protein